MISPTLLVVLISASAWLAWRCLGYLVAGSDLDNVRGPASPSFLYGHLKALRNKQGWEFHREVARKYGAIVRLSGPLGRKMLFVYDPKAMHHIAVKDQEIFEEAPSFFSVTRLSFGLGLLATNGDQHRRQLFYNVTHKLREAIETRARNGPAEVNMVGWMGRTALELIGQAGLGYSFDPLVEDRADPYAEAIKSFVPTLSMFGPFIELVPLCEKYIPERWLRPLARLVPFKPLQKMLEITKTMHERSTEIFLQKKQALLLGDEAIKLQVGEGKDIMSVLLKANMSSSVEDRLPEDELIGQMTTLTFAAMDTTSNALSLTLWRLAQNQDVQDRVRQEITEALESQGGKDIGYDDLVSLQYLDAVCRETLRVHVPAPFRFREARQDVMLPLSEPVRGLDGRDMREILVPKGTMVFVSVESSNTNTEIWGPDGKEWKPERWLRSLPHTVQDAKMPGVYSNLMTFWAGGRACIGFKFSQLEMKVVLAVLLSTFKFELSEKPIVWNLAGVTYPSVAADGHKPEMPMKVTLLEKNTPQDARA